MTVPWACSFCCSQKLRCAKTRPCSQCTKRGRECTPQQECIRVCIECGRQRLKGSEGRPGSRCVVTGEKCRYRKKKIKQACYTCGKGRIKFSENFACDQCMKRWTQCWPVYGWKNNKNITRNALGSGFSEDQPSVAGSPAVSLPGDVSRSPTPTPSQFVDLYEETLVQSPRSDRDSLRNTSCSPRPRINPARDNPPNNYGPDRSDSVGHVTWILCSMVFPPNLGNDIVHVEAYISSFHPGGQVVLKLTPDTITTLVRKHRLNYSGYPSTNGDDWYQTELQLVVLYAQFHQVLVNFVYFIHGDILATLRERQEQKVPESIWKHVQTLMWGFFFPLSTVYIG